jgi:UDP-N-acetylmuramyl pentapeptide phosphotransferase/UDP-N-acetylglucosamine-1-phosphate transferase
MSRGFKITMTAILIGIVAVALTFAWPLVAIAAVILIPVIGIIMVLRAIVNEFRGKRIDYVAGPTRMSHIPNRPEKFRHFSTPNPLDEEKEKDQS